MAEGLKIVVPAVPVSVNTYARHGGGSHYKTREAIAFEQMMAFYCRNKSVIGERFHVDMRVCVGPKQHPDTDNLPKQILDGLAKSGVFVSPKGKILSDSYVRKITVERVDDQRDKPRTEIEVFAL